MDLATLFPTFFYMKHFVEIVGFILGIGKGLTNTNKLYNCINKFGLNMQLKDCISNGNSVTYIDGSAGFRC